MIKNKMSFKAIINNLAKNNKVSAQSVLQTYMLERFLERIALSEYKNNFVLKGGMLIGAILGIDSRTTMDMDTTIKGLTLSEENLHKTIGEIIKIEVEDEITFKINKIEQIREKDDYAGFRCTLEANYANSMPVIMKIDITTGDMITYKEINYKFGLMLEDRKIDIWAYNLETILAEKFETVIARGLLTTRIRDYYDIYMILNTQNKNINFEILSDAISLTFEHRNTIELLPNSSEIVTKISEDDNLKSLWKNYQKANFYAQDISFEDLITSLKFIIEKIKFKAIV